MVLSYRLIAILTLAWALIVYQNFPALSADFLALWLAGQHYAAGQLDLIYPPMGEVFTMMAPAEWRAFMAAEYDYNSPVYPFLYPPLWAWVGSFLSGINWWMVTIAASLLNALLVIWMAILAFQATASRLHPILFTLLSIALVSTTTIGDIALFQNQPQIFVSFLLVLAVERSRAGAEKTAGVALALAAAIKIYPAIFALLWLAGGQRRALASFAVVGGALGLLSIAVAGWPLHVVFLQELALISSTVFYSTVSICLDAFVAHTFFGDSLNMIVPPWAQDESGWFVMPRPLVWRLASGLLLVAALGGLARLYARADHDLRHALVWPLALTVVSFLMPFSWIYYFIPTAAFAPVLIERLGQRSGAVLLLVAAIPVFEPTARALSATFGRPTGVPNYIHIMWVSSILILLAGFVIAVRRHNRNLSQPQTT